MGDTSASQSQPTRLADDGMPMSNSQMPPTDIPAATNSMDPHESIKGSISISAPTTDASCNSGFSDVPDNPASSQCTDVTTISDTCTSAITLSGEADCNLQMEPKTCNDNTNSAPPTSVSKDHAHSSQADNITSCGSVASAATYPAQSSQALENNNSQQPEHTSRTIDEDHNASLDQNAPNPGMLSQTDGGSPQDEDSLFVTDTDEIELGRLLQQHVSHNQVEPSNADSNRSYAIEAANHSNEAFLTSLVGFGLQYSRQSQHDPNDPAQLRTVETAKAAEVNTAARRKTGPRPRTAKEWFANKSKHDQRSVSNVTGEKRKRSEYSLEFGISHQKRRKRQNDATQNSKGHGKSDRSVKVMSAMFQSLSSNPIDARIAHGNVPEADPIKATTKGDQLQQIMKGLPQNADRRSVAQDRRKLVEATKSFGNGNCTAIDGKWLVKGMKSALYAHQVIGTSWMLGREFGDDGPRGGILADEMGMGKTLQTLACIVSNQPSGQDIETYDLPTLIVAPATAIDQWQNETKKHVELESYTEGMIHYKRMKKIPIKFLRQASIM